MYVRVCMCVCAHLYIYRIAYLLEIFILQCIENDTAALYIYVMLCYPILTLPTYIYVHITCGALFIELPDRRTHIR